MSDALIRSEELIRVTSVPYRRSYATVVRGVPVGESHLVKSATYFVSVIAQSDYLPIEPTPGQIWKVSGHKTIKAMTHGAYKASEHSYRHPDSFDMRMPETGESFIAFISKDKAFTGIGKAKARQLWSRFGKDIHRMLTEGDAQDLNALKESLSDQSIKALYAGYAKYENLRHTGWMSKARIPHSVQQRILKHRKRGTVEAIKGNPYELINFGLKFQKIDALLKGIHGHAWEYERYPEQRKQAAMVQAIKDCMKDGSTWVKLKQVKTRAADIMKSEKLSEQGIQWLKKTPSVAIHHVTDERLHPTATAIQELAVAKRIDHLLSVRTPLSEKEQNILEDVLSQLPYELTSKQQLAIMTSLSERLSCITGGPGTGKTTVIGTFLKVADSIGYSIYAVTLSGRAAMRLHASIGYQTVTIARFLREDPVVCSEGDKALLMIGEASMIDLPTMFRIINHVDPSVKIVLTGDPSQLPPIGSGKILHDLVLSERVRTTMLDIVKCQKEGNGIPEYSKLVNAGIVPTTLSTGNIHFHEFSDSNLAFERAIELYLERPGESRIIAPTSKLVSQVNESIQERCNSDSPLINVTLDGEEWVRKLRLHDQVLFTQNHPNAGVEEGSLGRLVSVDQQDDVFGIVELDTNEMVEIDHNVLEALELGYAMTLHKAQGGQFPRVIVLLREGRTMDRSWIYTALTRAELEVHIIGSPDVFMKVIEAPSKAFNRKTFLAQLIDFLGRS